jgi:hypothetical protein
MPRIRTVHLADAKSRLKDRKSGHDARAPYREAIANMTDIRMIELEPDVGESMRGLKLNVTRAAKEVNRHVAYGVSVDAPCPSGWSDPSIDVVRDGDGS